MGTGEVVHNSYFPIMRTKLMSNITTKKSCPTREQESLLVPGTVGSVGDVAGEDMEQQEEEQGGVCRDTEGTGHLSLCVCA